MNSKAIRKQLLAAVAMVLVAAVALGSSTYAWFVASGTVKAEGMSVKAKSEGGLIIRYKGGAWGTTATAGMEQAKELKPTSTDDLTSWVYAQAAAPGASKANDNTFVNVTSNITPTTGKDDVEQTNNEYALVKLFQIRSATKENLPKGLYVESIDVDGTQSMSTALRVGVVCTSGSAVTRTIYAPVTVGDTTKDENKPSGSYTVMKPKDGGGFERASTAFSPVKTGMNSETSAPYKAIVNSNTIIGNTDATQVEVYIYVWFEGEDHNLYSDNFYTEDLEVSVNFTSISTDGTVTKVNLNGKTTDTTAVPAKDGATAESTTNFFAITGVKTTDGAQLYTKTSGTAVTVGTSVYTIADGVATPYTYVVWSE